MSEKTRANVKDKYADRDYPINIIGRQFEVTEPIKKYAIEKLSKIDRFGGRVIDINVIMHVQKLIHSVDFLINVNNTVIKVSGKSDNMYASIDQAMTRLKAKLRRYVGKLHEHHAKKLVEIDVNVNVLERIPSLQEINDQIEEENLRHIEEEMRPHQIVNKETRSLKTLTLEEAIMKMELSEESFFLFRGEEDRKLKVLYRRDDGNYGVIEAE